MLVVMVMVMKMVLMVGMLTRQCFSGGGDDGDLVGLCCGVVGEGG